MFARAMCKRARVALILAPCLVLLAASVAPAREVLTPEEQAERELERKRQAEPVLECEPRSLRDELKRGETKGLRLSIGNAGGQGLHWAVISAPKWASPDRRSGELGYQEKRGVLVTLDPEGLPAGETSGVIVVEGRDRGGKEVKGSPAAVRVTVDLEAEAPPEEEVAVTAPAPKPSVKRRWRTMVGTDVVFDPDALVSPWCSYVWYSVEYAISAANSGLRLDQSGGVKSYDWFGGAEGEIENKTTLISWRYYLLRRGPRRSRRMPQGPFVSCGIALASYRIRPNDMVTDVSQWDSYSASYLGFGVGYSYVAESGLALQLSVLQGMHLSGDDMIPVNYAGDRFLDAGDPSLIAQIGYSF